MSDDRYHGEEIIYYIDDINKLPMPKYMNEYDSIRQFRNWDITPEDWDAGVRNDDIIYYGLYVNGVRVSGGSIEKYTPDKWETASIRTEQDQRGHGYASQIVYFITKKILEQGKIATIRTFEENYAMTKIIKNFNFQKL